MALGELFHDSFTNRRDAIAVEYTHGDGTPRSLTFGEVDTRANHMVNALQARGLAHGDRLAVHLANSIDFIDLFLACTRLGVVFVPMNVLYREREIAHITTDSSPKLIVTSERHLDLFPPGAPLVSVESLAVEATTAPDHALPGAPEHGDALAIVYTSGTTGRAKGAVLSHDNFAANTVNLVDEWRITKYDRYLAVLPLFHVHGLANGLCTWLASGCVMRLLERFEHATAAAQFESFRPTVFFGVPTIYARLLELSADVAVGIGQGMRLFVSGSAPLPADAFNAFGHKFGHAILERYGMSETLMITANPYAGERRPGTVGVPLPDVSVRLASTDNAEGGEVQVRGPNVFSAYWNDAAATEAAFDDGWFKTGDIAECSSDGYYTLRGRVSDLIICGGFNVYPREIEEVLLEQPGVREAAVVGVPDDLRGEVPIAYLVTEAALDADALRTACLEALASFKLPRAFVRVDALPRNAMGKVQRHLLSPRTGT